MDHLRPRKTSKHHPYDIESIGIPRSVKARHPVSCRPRKLTLLSPVNRPQGAAERRRYSRLHFNERDHSLDATMLRPFRDQIDVTVSAAKSAVENVPPFSLEKLLGNPLAAFAQHLTCR